MNKIEQLRTTIEEADKMVAESESFKDIELTDEEADAIDERRKTSDKKNVVVVDEEGDGKTEIPIGEYLDGLDKNALRLKNDNILLMQRKVSKSAEELETEARETLKGQIIKSDISDEELDAAITAAIDAVKEYYKTDEITAEHVNQMSKLSAEVVLKLIPDAFIMVFSEPSNNKIKMKEDVLVSLAYCVTIGPEMDRLNDDIDHHNKMIDLMMRINDINIDFADILSSPESIREIGERILETRNIFAKDYSKYVKSPDAINNHYTQRAYTLEKLNAAYQSFYEKLTDEDEREVVLKEINNNAAMITVYQNILSLNNIHEAIENHIKFGADKRGKIAMKKLEADALAALKRFRKLKEAIAVPGYTGKETGAQAIYVNYLNFFRHLFPAYNKVINTAIANGDTALVVLDRGSDLFAKCLLIVLGRVAKKLSAMNTMDASAEIVITFDMVCRLGTELFMLEKLYKEMIPLMDIISE